MQHPKQSFQGQAPVRPVQQSPILSDTRVTQQNFAAHNAYAHPSGVQSPYLNHSAHFAQPPTQQSPQDNQYYTSNPSPRSSHSGNFYPTEKQEHMAAATTMQRPPYPPIYHTPQSTSPASVTSPQAHDHGRPMFAQQPGQMPQPMYSYTYAPINQMHSPYGSHTQPSMTPILQTSYTQPQVTHSQVPSQTPTLNTSPRIKPDPSQPFSQTPQQRASLQHPTPGPTPGSNSAGPPQNPGANTSTNAAPGPIPATTPLVVKQDNNGVQWIAFEYSRDRVKMEYTIRCDVESVETNNLLPEFKSENCVYPRACVPREQYKGNRLNYESECNQVGWALAELNPCLRGKRGLIQRAVDSWRNSNQDVRLRSRRVRRQNKISTKNRQSAAGPTQSGPMQSGMGGPASIQTPNHRAPSTLPSAGSQIHHHHVQHEMSPITQDPSSAPGYSTTQSLHRSSSTAQQLASPNELRHAQTFPSYQTFPPGNVSMGPSMTPTIPGNLHHYGRQGSNANMTQDKKRKRDDEDADLFGDLPEGKKRKFILVDDTQKAARVRVKVTLDQVNIQDIPDSYRKQNSVYPRSYYPIQMHSESPAGRFSGDEVEPDNDAPTIGRMVIPCTTTEGESQIEVSRLTRGKRDREQKINELGYRMAWGQGRVFSNRPIFLARALDAYRTKQRLALVGTGQETSIVPPHLEVRPGKRRWLERTRPSAQPDSPRPKTTESL